MKLKTVSVGVGLAAAVASVQAAEVTLNFDTVAIGAPAGGVWYTDRYAPAGFASTAFDGDNRLKHSIDGTQQQADAFRNTQGRKYDLTSSTTSLSVELWVDDSWYDQTARWAGLWGTAFAAGGSPVTSYPIIEFANGGFRFWDSAAPGAWTPANDLLDIDDYDQWYTLSMELVGGNWAYSVSNEAGTVIASHSIGALGSAYIGNAMLQGHNAGASYDIYWDNLTFNVPEPGSLALAGIALLGLAAMRRRAA